MGQHEGPGPAIGPRVEVRDRPLRDVGYQRDKPRVEVVQSVLDGPCGKGRPGLHTGEQAPQTQLNRAGKRRPGKVVATYGRGAACPGYPGAPDGLVTLRPESPHHLTRIERQEDAALAVAPDVGDMVGVGVEDRLRWFPSLAGSAEHGRGGGTERNTPEERAIPQPVAAGSASGTPSGRWGISAQPQQRA